VVLAVPVTVAVKAWVPPTMIVEGVPVTVTATGTGAAVTITVALELFVVSATEVAVMVTDWGVAGAVKTPA
jgi:hypothetical protein